MIVEKKLKGKPRGGGKSLESEERKRKTTRGTRVGAIPVNQNDGSFS